MGKYLHHYETLSEFQQDYNGEGYIEPWVSYTENTAITGMKAQLEGEQNQTEFELVGEVEYEIVK